MRWPIRNQIMLPLVAVAIASLMAVGAIHAVVTERRTGAQIEQQLRRVLGVLTTSNFPLTEPVLWQMRELCGADFVLCDEADSVVASTLTKANALPAATPVKRIEEVTLGPTASVGGRSYFHTVIDSPPGTRAARSVASQKGFLHVLFPQDEYRRAWREAFVPSLAVGAATLVVVALVAGALASRMGRGIARLREEVKRIALGDFHQVSLPAIDDEIHDLGVAVNCTAGMLADYEQQVRRSEQIRTVTLLGASIAHQIRNAATGCRMALDLHAADGNCTAGDHGESLDVARTQLRLMESQLQRFLRVGQRTAHTETRELDMRSLVEDLLPLVRPAAQHAGVQLDCRISTRPVAVRADEEALGQVVINLLLNAIQAAQKNGLERQGQRRVSVDVGATQSDFAELVVSDSGAGPSDGVSGSLFEPFVSDKAEGAGLGLSVAKDIVVAHGGSITWTREGVMTRFRVRLPLASSESSNGKNLSC